MVFCRSVTVKRKNLMTLHAAIEKLLHESGRPMTTKEIADRLNKNNWYPKKDGSKITDFQIHGRTRNYSQLFKRNGAMVSLAIQQQRKAKKVQDSKQIITRKVASGNTGLSKDEHYVLELCDEVLGLTCSRQHRFDFLLGDKNLKGIATKLPVDGYYEELKLAIEYRERQHSEAVSFFDKPGRMTISGVHRGEQRKVYDERRRQILPKYGITLIEFSYSDFSHGKQKRIIREENHDKEIVGKKLKPYVDRS
jgi:hypothetical protein